MNESKRKQLLVAARACPPVGVPPAFQAGILRRLRACDRDVPSASLFDQLSVLFPKLAGAALVVIVLAAGFAVVAGGDLVAQLTEVSDQWLLPIDWL